MLAVTRRAEILVCKAGHFSLHGIGGYERHPLQAYGPPVDCGVSYCAGERKRARVPNQSRPKCMSFHALWLMGRAGPPSSG
jgi:hypothetical protein